MAINPCISLNERLEQAVSALEDIEDTVLGTLDEVKDQIEAFTDTPTSPQDLTDALVNITEDAIDAGLSDMSIINNFVGSCLDDVINKVDEFRDSILDAVGSLFDDIPTLNSLVEKAIGQTMAGLKGLITGFKIPDILSELDRLLACLSDQPDLAECLSGLQVKSDRINSVLSNLNLSDDGMFDQSSFLGTMPGVDDLLKNNINTITDKMDIVEVSVLSNIDTTKQSIAEAMPSEDLF